MKHGRSALQPTAQRRHLLTSILAVAAALLGACSDTSSSGNSPGSSAPASVESGAQLDASFLDTAQGVIPADVESTLVIDGLTIVFHPGTFSRPVDYTVALNDPPPLYFAGRPAGQSLSLDLSAPPDLPVEVRFPLTSSPTDGEELAFVHVLDDGTTSIEVLPVSVDGDVAAVELTSFSDWFPWWLNPVNWIAGVIDLAADSLTGRTDPPGCRNDPPEWAEFGGINSTLVHTCFQMNRDAATGVDRAEVLIKSNTGHFLVIVPPTGVDFVWVEAQNDKLRAFLSQFTGVGAGSILLPPGKSMSFGWSRPGEVGWSGEVGVLQTEYTALFDLGDTIGEALTSLSPRGEEGGPVLDVLLPLLCYADAIGVDALELDVVPDLDAERLQSILLCHIEVLARLENRDVAVSAIENLLGSRLSGLTTSYSEVEMATWFEEKAVKLGKWAGKIAKIFSGEVNFLSNHLTRLYDSVLLAAQGSYAYGMTLALPPTTVAPPTSAPARSTDPLPSVGRCDAVNSFAITGVQGWDQLNYTSFHLIAFGVDPANRSIDLELIDADRHFLLAYTIRNNTVVDQQQYDLWEGEVTTVMDQRYESVVGEQQIVRLDMAWTSQSSDIWIYDECTIETLTASIPG